MEREAFLTLLGSAPWDRENKQEEADRRGERWVGILTAATSLKYAYVAQKRF